MFSGLRKNFNLDFLDNKIAEEQEKQQKHRRAPPSSSRPPSKGTLRPSDAQKKAAAKGPDPDSFVIGDDASDISRATTPIPPSEAETQTSSTEPNGSDVQDVSSTTTSTSTMELPADVKQKLAKLEQLTTRYQDLLRNYRTAHAHVAAIEPFEATLREHTPLTSISEPGALVEFLNQRSLQSEMVLQELKRITSEHNDTVKERDELKKKLEEKDSFFSADDEISKDAGATKISELEKELQEQKEYINELSTENAFMRHDLEITRLDLDAQENKVRLLESQLAQRPAQGASADQGADDDTANNLRTQLAEKQEQLEAMIREKESALEEEKNATNKLVQTESILVDMQEKLKQSQQSLEEKAAQAEENLRKYQEEHAENLKSGKYVQRDEKRMDTLQNLVKTLQEQRKQAEDAKKRTESESTDLRLQIKLLEAESNSSEGIIADLRRYETIAKDLKKRIIEVEHERDDAHRIAESKKGHEAAVASLRSQLKRAEKDRDNAYQAIIDCGKCNIPGPEHDHAVAPSEQSISTPETRSRLNSDVTEVSTLPTEVSTPATPATPSLDENSELAAPVEGKKKKKKSKAKKKKAPSDGAASPAPTKGDLTLDDMLLNPELASDVMLKAKFGDNPMLPLFARMVEQMKERNEGQDDEHEARQRTLEDQIEQLQQNVKDQSMIIRHREDDIARLEEAIRTNSALTVGSAETERQIEEYKKLVERLQEEMSEKSTQIIKLQERLNGEASLRDEIEELKEEREELKNDVLEHGSAAAGAKHELKETRDRVKKVEEERDEVQMESDEFCKKMKDAEAQKDFLTSRCSDLETEIKALKEKTLSSDELDRLKGLEKELSAANHLAQTRYKDLNNTREAYNKLQSELKKLREESAELKIVKSDLEKATTSLKRLEAKEKDLRSEIAEYKSQAVRKDGEITSLKGKLQEATEKSTALQDSYETVSKALESSNTAHAEATEARNKLQAESKRFQDQLTQSRPRLEELEKQVKKFMEEASVLREELQLKQAQHDSAQSLMDSMRDQTRELATQMKEKEEKTESLEEELADAHRLLAERSREAETMRRLLNDVEGRADSRVREMRQQMDLAVEERDRAEQEASTIGRRKAREIEALKERLASANSHADGYRKAAEEAEEKEQRLRQWLTEVEKASRQAREEIIELRTVMSQLQETLDETERQSNMLEKEKLELRKALEERDSRLEKLQRSSRSMAEELRTLQAARKQAGTASSRASIDSSRVASPSPRHSTASNDKGVDAVYLKSVLLQFLEQKEKKHQLQLVPVLSQLLNMSKEDEAKWYAVVQAKY